MLGLPVWGIGPTVGIFGNVADPIASTLAGNFTDSVSRTVLSGSGSIDVGSFVRSVAVGTVNDFAYSQLNQTGLPLVLGVASQTAAFTSDVYGAFRDVLTPPMPIYVQPPVTAQQVANEGPYDPVTGLTRLPDDPDAIYLQPPRSIWSQSSLVQPGIHYDSPGNPGTKAVRQADGVGGNQQGFFQWAYETAADYSPHRVPLNFAENVYGAAKDLVYFEPAGGSTTASSGEYQPTIKGTIIPNSVVVATKDPSYVARLAQEGRISGYAADEAINDLLQGHTARLYVADRNNGLYEYLDFRQSAFFVEQYRSAALSLAAAPLTSFAVASSTSRAMSIANGVGRQVSRTANAVSRIEINPSLATTFSSGVNPHVFRIAPNTAAKIIDGGSPGSFTARELGEAISANPQASRFHSKLQDNGFDLKIVNKSDGNAGLTIADGGSPLTVTINRFYNTNVDDALKTLAHESKHVDLYRNTGGKSVYGSRGIRKGEYSARAREFFFEHGRRPSAAERYSIMGNIISQGY